VYTSYKKQSGFTIVELLIVVVVIAILAAIAIVSYNGIQNRAKASAAQSTVSQAAKKIVEFSVLNGDTYPDTVSAAGISPSTSVTYQYYVNNIATPRVYCVTVNVGGVTFYQSSIVNTPTSGVCPGHNSVALECPAGYIQVPGNSSFGTNDFCMMKYEATNVGGAAVSQAGSTPWVNISQTSAITAASAVCDGCHLMSEAEWMTVAANVLSVSSNWSGGAVGSGFIFSGHNDNSPANTLTASVSDTDGYNGTGNTAGSTQRRTLTLTNGEVVWDLAGNVLEWTNATIAGGQQPGIAGESAYGWKQWNSPSIVWNGLPTNSRSSAISSVDSTWTNSKGIGQLYSYVGEVSTRAFMRGGHWYATSNAGVLTLYLSNAPSSTGTYVGFRTVR
jgi:prepilin-type N-terminal cleavage/methylation domain-containing protein